VINASAGRLARSRRRCTALITGLVRRMLRLDSFTVPATPDQVRVARHRVTAALGPGHPCLDAAAEVTSELVTNAGLYGSGHANAQVKVRVRLLWRCRVRLAVIDEGGTGHVPAIQRPAGDAPNGRGLLIVSALARRLDWARHGAGHRISVLLDPARPGQDAIAEAARPLGLDAFLALDDALDDAIDHAIDREES
jgi:anti-sigma regulatory factor (Ser/Thr protein kinase)